MVAWFTLVVEGNYIRQPVSLLFPHSCTNKEKMRKQQGNHLLQLASDMPCNQGNHSVVKTTNYFLV